MISFYTYISLENERWGFSANWGCPGGILVYACTGMATHPVLVLAFEVCSMVSLAYSSGRVENVACCFFLLRRLRARVHPEQIQIYLNTRHQVWPNEDVLQERVLSNLGTRLLHTMGAADFPSSICLSQQALRHVPTDEPHDSPEDFPHFDFGPSPKVEIAK